METNDDHINPKKRKTSEISGRNDSTFETRYEAMKAENVKLKKESEVHRKSILNLVYENTELKSNQSNDNADAVEALEAEIERLKEVEAKLQTELEEAQTKMEEERKLCEDEIAALKSNAEARGNRISELEEQISLLQDVKVDIEIKNYNAEKEIKTFQLRINELKEQIDQLTQKDAEWEAQAEDSLQKIDALDKEINELKMQLTSAEDVRNDLEKLKNDKKELEAEITALNSQIDGLTEMNAISKAEAEKANNVIATQDKEINELQKQLSSADAANKDLTRKITAAAEVGTDYMKKNKELEEQLNVLMDETELCFNGMKQKEDEANAIIEDQQKKIQELEDQLRQASIQANRLFTLNETNSRQLSVDDIHDGPKIRYDRLGLRTIINIVKLEASDSKLWKLYSTETSEPFEMDIAKVFKRTRFELCLTDALVCIDKQNKKRMKEILPSISSCSLTSLTLIGQNIEENEFLKLVSSAKIVKFNDVSIWKPSKGERNRAIRIDEIMKALPNIESFEHSFRDVNNDAIGLLAQLPRFEKLKKFKLHNCGAIFDLKTFVGFIEKHPNVSFVINFHKYNSIYDATVKELKLSLPEFCKNQVVFED